MYIDICLPQASQGLILLQNITKHDRNAVFDACIRKAESIVLWIRIGFLLEMSTYDIFRSVVFCCRHHAIDLQ